MKRTTKIGLTSSLLWAATLSLAGNPAIAGDKKTLPGTTCVELTPSDAISYAKNGAVTAAENTTIMCPVIRDKNTKKGPRQIDVRLFSFRATTNTCYFTWETSTGSSGGFKIESVTGVGAKNITFKSKGNVNKAASYNITCRLQTGDSLHSYVVDE